MQRKKLSLFAFLKITVLWDQLNFISSLNFDTILGAVLLYQWLLRFFFQGKWVQIYFQTQVRSHSAMRHKTDPVSSSTRKWSISQVD